MLAWRPLSWAAVWFLGAMQARTAHASDPAPRVRFELHAAAGCPSASEFTANVRAKALFELEDSPDRASRTFVVNLGERTAGSVPRFRGVLRVVTPNGTASSRVVNGINCAEVAEAIAVIIAIELGSENLEEPEPGASAAPEPEVRPRPASPALPPRWRWAGVADFGFTSAAASASSPETRLSLALRRESSELWSPEFRAGFLYVDGSTTSNAGGNVELTLYGLALEACPIGLRFSRLLLEPCASTVVALRRASGGPPSNPEAETSSGSWAEVGGLARVSFALSGAWWLEFSAEGFGVLIRDRFTTFSPELAVFEPPAVGARLLLGLGLHFQ